MGLTEVYFTFYKSVMMGFIELSILPYISNISICSYLLVVKNALNLYKEFLCYNGLIKVCLCLCLCLWEVYLVHAYNKDTSLGSVYCHGLVYLTLYQ